MILLDSLTGMVQEAVIFVMDYIQIQFSEALLTVYSYPKISKGLETLNKDDSNYYKTIISNNGCKVTEVISNLPNERIIRFNNRNIVTISLQPEDDDPENYMLRLRDSRHWDVE